MSKTVFSYKNRVIHSPALCESSSASEIHCGSSADDYVLLWESDAESVLFGFQNRARSHLSSPESQTKWWVQLGSRLAERKEGKLGRVSGGRMR